MCRTAVILMPSMRLHSEFNRLLMTNLLFFQIKVSDQYTRYHRIVFWVRVVLPRKQKVQSKHILIWLSGSKQVRYCPAEHCSYWSWCYVSFCSLIVYPEFQIYLGFCSAMEVRLFCLFEGKRGELTVACILWEQGRQCLSEEGRGTSESWEAESHTADRKWGRFILVFHNDSCIMQL